MYRYITILVLFFAEITLFEKLKFFGVRPELLLITTIFFGFRFGVTRGVEIGALAGILKDIFSITTFGINTFSFLLVGFLSGYLKDKVVKENFVTQFLVSGLAVYLISGIYLIAIPHNTQFWQMVLHKALYTGFLAPFLFLGLTKIFEFKKT